MLLWSHGHATPTTVRLLFYSSATGTLSVVCNGMTYTASIDTSVDDGTAIVTIAGLTDDASFVATIGADSVSGIARVMPTSNEDATMAWVSCIATYSRPPGTRIWRGADVVLTLGDTPYAHSGSTYWSNGGLSLTGVGTDDSAAVFNAYHRALMMGQIPGWDELAHGGPFYHMVDDHEYGGDDWDSTIGSASENGGIPADPGPNPTQAEVDAHWLRGNTSRQIYHAGNPTGTYPGATAEKPSEADASAANYPPLYYKFSCGRADVFVMDCISHRSPYLSTDDASKTMLGSVQKALLKSALSSSTATFKVIVSTKTTYRHPDFDGNHDPWAVYTTERDELLAYIHANITGCIWISGDQHYPHVISLSTDAGDGVDHVCVVACPTGTQITSGVPALGSAPVVWVRGIPDAVDKYFGRLHIRETYMQADIVHEHRGVVWSGRVNAGSNALSYPTTRTS